MRFTLTRKVILLLAAAMLLSCGGGGGSGGGSAVGVGIGAGSSPTATGSADSGTDAGGGSGDAGPGSASGSAGGGESTASNGDGSGVGSGGTGVSTAGASVGSADGLGSIIINGLRYDTDTAEFVVRDAPELRLGMTAKVLGPVNADFTAGTATRVESAADLRGPVSAIDVANGTLAVAGTTVTTDAETVWADATGIAAIAPTATLQVWGLPGASGTLRATRIEQAAPAPLITTGAIQSLNLGLRLFVLGGLTIDVSAALSSSGIDPALLTNGTIVRVRSNAAPLAGLLSATSIELWNPLPRSTGLRVQLAGLVTDYSAPSSFSVLGTRIDASAAQITGGPSTTLGNGVKVEVAGTLVDGVLRASKLKVKQVPGTGGPSSFTLIGTVGAFSSPANFRVRGQPVDASAPDVEFVNGTRANLGNGARLTVSGPQVTNGVLIAKRVVYD